ncbi:hypothetical protein [Flavobacterium faecale]|uniref:hypothetical protein n=1 Tax=Flavobacterium faecale TaxID=1355330 RepID=UPI003AABC97D
MRVSKEIINGFIIFSGIALYFMLMNVLGYADIFYLRLFNVVFVFYGVNRTIEMNLSEGKLKFIENATSAMITSVIGVVLSVVALIAYSYFQGGDAYVHSLSKTFLFGGNPSIEAYSICLLFEGIASSVIVTMLLMLYWNNKLYTD